VNSSNGQIEEDLKGHDHWISAVAYSPDGLRLATASWDRTVKLWNTATGEHVRTLGGYDTPVESLVFAADSQRLATVSVGQTRSCGTWPRMRNRGTSLRQARSWPRLQSGRPVACVGAFRLHRQGSGGRQGINRPSQCRSRGRLPAEQGQSARLRRRRRRGEVMGTGRRGEFKPRER